MYGLPKLHKVKSPDVVQPFRSIVFSVNTYNYQLAKYLSNLLQLHLPSTYTISDTFSFVQEPNSTNISKKFMVSFDVVTLLTNIPGILVNRVKTSKDPFRNALILLFLMSQMVTLISNFPSLTSLHFCRLLLLKLIFSSMAKCMIR